MPRTAERTRLRDTPGRQSAIQRVPVKNADAAKRAVQVKQLIAVKSRSQGTDDHDGFDAVHDSRTNQIALIGPKDRVAEIESNNEYSEFQQT